MHTNTDSGWSDNEKLIATIHAWAVAGLQRDLIQPIPVFPKVAQVALADWTSTTAVPH